LSQPSENTNQKRTVADDGLSVFFLVVTPGLETLAQKELFRWIAPNVEVTLERGGLTVRLPLVEGCELNRVLKIPTRLLLRLADFGCRDFPKLFKKTSNLPWADWIPVGSTVDFQASSHKSRLFIKKRIEETCRDGFKKYLKSQVPLSEQTSLSGARSELSVLVRVDDDVCTFSLDTSGELLHKRGTKTLSSEAPLRETIAAALLTWMSTEGPRESEPLTLIDPMIGSGTFVIEAAQMSQTIRARNYAFELFPKYQRETCAPPESELKTETRTETEAADDTPIASNAKSPEPILANFTAFIGLDIDAKAAEATRGNWRGLGDQRELKIEIADIFDAKPIEVDGLRWLITNPPYGERLKIEGRLKDYYELLFESCERAIRPDRACFILPDTARPEKLRAPGRWQLQKTLKFQNGGLPVTALLFSGNESGK
jgi:putative N6-adenine-specific DNA methylase